MNITGKILSVRNLAGRNNYIEKIDLADFHPWLHFPEMRIGEGICKKKITLMDFYYYFCLCYLLFFN